MPLNPLIFQRSLKDIDPGDPFFDSLKRSNHEFFGWLADNGEAEAFVSYDSVNRLQAFLYLEEVKGPINEIEPVLDYEKIMKVRLFKIGAYNTKLCERFVEIIVESMEDCDAQISYMPVYSGNQAFIDLIARYGFYKHGIKSRPDGSYDVFVKNNCGATTLGYYLLTGSNGSDEDQGIAPEVATGDSCTMPDAPIEDPGILQGAAEACSEAAGEIAGEAASGIFESILESIFS